MLEGGLGEPFLEAHVAQSRAVRWHIDHRILVYDKKTVIFD